MIISRRKYEEPTLIPVACPRPLNALTIDVEDYFHAANLEHCLPRSSWDQLESRVAIGTLRLLDLLAEANVRATFFILGWVARRQRRLVRAIQATGHEIGSHGYAHHLIYQQSPARFRADVCQARNLIEDITGEPVTAYRAPNFSITSKSLWALDVLIEEGFTLDSSIYPIRHDRYGMPGARLEPHPITRPAGTIWEFPPPVWKVRGCALPVGGGGYFRLFPYALTRRGLRAINAAGRPFAVYLHPWELDPEQPRYSPGWLGAFRHYVNLGRTETRLVQLLRDFRLGTLSEALADSPGFRTARKAVPASLPACVA
jgi:polysaccharide deacetylase family protein (PEP-CTERM system associated)